MSIVMKPCAYCSELFPSKRSTAKFCSARCQSASFRSLREQADKPTYEIHNKPKSLTRKIEETTMSVTKQEEIRLKMHGVDVTILIDHRPADPALQNMTPEEIKAFVENAISNLLVTGSIQ